MDVGRWRGEGGGRWVQGGGEGRKEVGGCRTVERGEVEERERWYSLYTLRLTNLQS